ncbi:MAG: hypothetical protein ACFCVH_16260 [Alphaproteobacteria bacterium]
MPLTLSLTDAEAAFKQILTQFMPYIPKATFEMVKKKPIGDIYEICNATRYKALFDITWNRTFEKANRMVFAGRTITAAMVPAFTTDVADIATRKIYLQDGVIESWGTYWHEAVHYLQHPDMYPTYYAMGGDAPFRMEGLTEYCTRYGSTRVAKERELRQSYQKNFQRTQSYIGTDLGREGDLFEVNFKGTGLPANASNVQICSLLQGIVP